jgi:hypothetical protein
MSCKKENPDVVTTHCFIHREMLVSKTLREEIKKILDDATKKVYQTKTSSLQNVSKTV